MNDLGPVTGSAAGSLEELASALLDDGDLMGEVGWAAADADARADAGTAEPAVLRLDEILSDANNEVVLDGGESALPVLLEQAGAIAAQGIAAAHVTASGEDVTGLAYVTFDSGLTLYFPEDLQVNVVDVG
jgi:hypothetical protein